MPKQKLAVNALPISLKEQEQHKLFFFSKEKQGERAPLTRKEYPDSFAKRYPKSSKEYDVLYTDFTPEPAEDGFEIDIDLEEAPGLAKHYLHKRIFEAFKGVADFRKRDFINGVELWFRDKPADEVNFRAYKKFKITTRRTWFSAGWALFIQYTGHSFIHPVAINSEEAAVDTTELTRVAYNRHIFHYEEIPEDKLSEIDFSKMYPVVNFNIRDKMQQFPVIDPFKNKVKEYVDEIDRFKNMYLIAPAVEEVLPFTFNDDNWCEIKIGTYHTVPNAGSKLVFRDGQTEIHPFYGIRNHGPFMPPKHSHIRFLFIMSKRDIKGAGKQFYEYLKGEVKGVDGFNRYANIPSSLRGEMIEFENEQNPLPEIIDGLNNMEREAGVAYFAFYISPIDREVRNRKERLVYYRVKEELLKRKIASQVVERSTIEKADFRYSIPNIAVATVAKLGGIPWKLTQPPEAELIVGIGAFQPREFDKRYLGSAFCFQGDGTFSGLRCFTKDEPHMLAGSIREAVQRYADENRQVERLVIHFYKTMSYDERKPILATLKELGLDIPVVVVTINKTEYEQTILFDLNSSMRLPLSGTYFSQRRDDILLSNNTRYRKDSEVKRGFPFPVRLQLWCSKEGLLDDEGFRERLITQVYRFSRLYWKSVSQQNLPVTIKYPEMLAEKFPYFNSRSLPSFGEKSLWFL
ncbi:Piwi domain-containing protein [Rhodohalobacter halophilus]|uniref:Piwi domain-containing protein n=1 Tax=Rhodohalobacter halophilus TaxID=1812810 RepID=UPI000AF527A7|nr:Piwi domain-containing protein [Rhodohalobacter halophilus]